MKESYTKGHRKEKPPAGTGGHQTVIPIHPHDDYNTSFLKDRPSSSFSASPSSLVSPSGLSICHIVPRPVLVRQEPFLELAINGTYCHVGVVHGSSRGMPSNKRRNTKRGKIRSFSRRSRIRLMRVLSRLDKSKMPYFITLTYPSSYPSSREAKGDLKAFAKRLVRLAPTAGLIWKMEYQERGAPHFHLLVWGLDRFSLTFLRKWVSRAWFEVVGSGDERHLKAGTNVQRVRSWRGVMFYASKYMGKEVEVADDEPGRFWGMLNAKALPWSVMVRVVLDWAVFYKVRRVLSKVVGRRLKGYEPDWGFWAMVNVGDFLRFLEFVKGG